MDGHLLPICLRFITFFNILLYVHGSEVHEDVTFEKDYNIHQAPMLAKGKPLDVNFTVNLRNILEVNEKAQLISLETTLRMFWIDPRVKAVINDDRDYITLNPKTAENFWIPDIFIDRSKDIRHPAYYVNTASVRVYPDSKIRYSSRVNFDVACPMDFHNYPVDEQASKII